MSLKENLNKYDYLKEICKFSDLTNVNIEQLIKGVSNDEKKLWAIFARKRKKYGIEEIDPWVRAFC